jgi:hypothetical protein
MNKHKDLMLTLKKAVSFKVLLTNCGLYTTKKTLPAWFLVSFGRLLYSIWDKLGYGHTSRSVLNISPLPQYNTWAEVYYAASSG